MPTPEPISTPVRNAATTTAPSSPPPIRELAPTGTLVVELWETSGASDPIEGWEPAVFDPDHNNATHLTGRLVLLAMIISGLALGGWYLTGWQSSRAEAEIAATIEAGAQLDAATQRVDDAVSDFTGSDLAQSELASTALSDLDSAARTLFDIAAQLDPSDPATGELRQRALEAAQQALELETTLGDAFAYGNSLDSLLESPDLPTEVASDSIPDLAAQTAAWVSRFVEGAENLPTHPLLEEHRGELRAVAAGLEFWQSSYLDALRSGNVEGAEAARAELVETIGSLRASWDDAAADIATWATEAIGVLEQRLADLSRAG